jgi:hypothetical protein
VPISDGAKEVGGRNAAKIDRREGSEKKRIKRIKQRIQDINIKIYTPTTWSLLAF